MTDTISAQRRSEIMRNVKNKDSKPEMIVRKFLHSKGFRFRVHDKKLPGHPDIKLTKYKTTIFINGCFWHGHKSCKIYVMPKTNTPFWDAKIEKNILRDIKIINNLIEMDWRVITIWECELKSRKREQTLEMLVNKILSC
jgi:DNA mismatch endonuclease, patch repair protein